MEKRTRAPKLSPPEDPIATIEQWSLFHQRVLNEFQPRGRILFIPSCSGDKPYEISPSHQGYRQLLERVAPGQVDKVTLSGLLGPVPEAMEWLVATEYNYNFYLNRYSHLKGQLPLITDKLAGYMTTFLDKFGGHYDLCISYSRENYRKVMLSAATRCSSTPVKVLPSSPHISLENGIVELEAELRAVVVK